MSPGTWAALRHDGYLSGAPLRCNVGACADDSVPQYALERIDGTADHHESGYRAPLPVALGEKLS